MAAAAKFEYEHDYDSFWIGLNSLAVYNTFVWSDETDVDFTNWNGDEPNGYGNEPCVEMFATSESAGEFVFVFSEERRKFYVITMRM